MRKQVCPQFSVIVAKYADRKAICELINPTQGGRANVRFVISKLESKFSLGIRRKGLTS